MNRITASQPEAILPSRGHVAVPGDILGGHNWGVLLAYWRGRGQGSCTGQPPITVSSTQNVNSAEAEEPAADFGDRAVYQNYWESYIVFIGTF